MTVDELTALLASRIVDVPDFPVPGVLFKDISPLLADPTAFAAAVDAVAQRWDGEFDAVVGVEARGFLLAAPLAYRCRTALVPVRKPGKLPRPTREVAYDLEYGANVLQVHRDAFTPGERVLVVDDVLATGGTASAAISLVRAAGAVPVGLSVLLELGSLGGRTAVAAEHPELVVHALLRL